MSADWLSHVGAWTSSGLWRASWQGALCAVLAWGVSRAWPKLPASLRAGLWWLVALKFLVALGWLPSVTLPVLPGPVTSLWSRLEARWDEATAHRASPPMTFAKDRDAGVAGARADAEVPVAEAARSGARARLSGPVVAGAGAPGLAAAEPRLPERAFPWGRAAVGFLLVVWGAGVSWQALGLVRGGLAVRRLRASARPLVHPVLEAEVRALSAAAGLRRVPGLLVSEAVVSPLATGLRSPVVVLPAKAVRRLPVQALRMALAHELAHLRRGDLWLGWVPALAESLLFFHPLARCAAREYALAREEACDAEAIRLTGAEPADYGELLLAFGIARAPGTAAALGASSHVDALHRRLSMLEHVDAVPTRSRRLWKAALSALGVAALVPFQVVAREASGAVSQAQESPSSAVVSIPDSAPVIAVPAVPGLPVPPQVTPPAVAPAPAAPRVAVVSRRHAVGTSMHVGAVPTTPTTPKTPITPTTPVTPKTPITPTTPVTPTTPPAPPTPPPPGDPDSGYVLLADGVAMMNGSTVDLELARTFKQKGKEILFVRRKGEAFIIRDGATLKAVREALSASRELGQAQAELGGKQGALGRQQADLGRKQAAMGREQGGLGRKLGELAYQQSVLHQEAPRLDLLPETERERRRAELKKQGESIEQEMKALESKMAEVATKMNALSQEQHKLSEKQHALHEEQVKLSAQHQDRAREAEQKVQGLIDEALRKGLGQPMPT